MTFLLAVISIIWALGTMKLVLFWIYLWQLKDYHVGRFLDHFRTAKGKRIIFSYVSQFIFWRVKKPVFTAKVIFLTGVVVLIAAAYWLRNQTIGALILFNLLVPVIVSGVVLVFQPFFVAARNKILQQAKEKMVRFHHLKVIAITGSYGKTSTKEFLTTILAEKFNVLATPEHKNSEIGIAQTILQELKPEHEVFIVEMGAYNKGGIKLLCDIVKPSIGIVTGVNEQHLATFGSLENLLSAEGGRELLANLPKAGLLVVNGENKYCLDLYKRATIHKKIYTTSKERIASDLWAEELVVEKDYVSFIPFSSSRELTHVKAHVLGKHQIQNLMGAILLAKELGMTMEEITRGVDKIAQQQGGMTLRKGMHGMYVIDSSYSANPDGVVADLNYLNIFSGKKVVVMPSLIELGLRSSEIHYELGKKIAQVADLAIITTKDQFKHLKHGAISQGMPAKDIVFCENSHEIMTMIGALCSHGDAVLLEGRVPGALVQLLNEKQI